MPDERNCEFCSRFYSRMFTLNFVRTCWVFRMKPCARAFFLRVKKWGLWGYLSTNIHNTNEDGSKPVNRRLFKPTGLIHAFPLIEIFSKVHGFGHLYVDLRVSSIMGVHCFAHLRL
jgi:hypothetical protein